MNPVHQCAMRLNRFSPNKNKPRKADSRKKEKTPSITNPCPITPPVIWENRAQLVPNWNSMGIPVTTPKTKLMPKIFIQKRAALSYDWFPVPSAMVLRITMSGASPIVS